MRERVFPAIYGTPFYLTKEERNQLYAALPGKKLLPFICEQDYNRAIKKMIKLAGFDRMVTTLNTVTREDRSVLHRSPL